MAVVTEARIRSEYRKAPFSSYCIEQRDIITPSARQFLQDKKIELKVGDRVGPVLTESLSTEADSSNASERQPTAPAYICEQTGGGFQEKPAYMTVIDKNPVALNSESPASKTIVCKTDARVAFAGQMDLLQADILVAQVECREARKTRLYDTLQSVLGSIRSLLHAQVSGVPVDIESIVGVSKEELRNNIDSFADKQLADASMGRIVVSLNRLRARIRETELSAIRCFRQELKTDRNDIVEVLNQLADKVYVLMLEEQKQPEAASRI